METLRGEQRSVIAADLILFLFQQKTFLLSQMFLGFFKLKCLQCHKNPNEMSGMPHQRVKRGEIHDEKKRSLVREHNQFRF